MKRFVVGAAVVALGSGSVLVASTDASATEAQPVDEQEFVVVYAEDVPVEEARAAVEAAGGTIVSENTDVGVATVVTTNGEFAVTANADAALVGTAQNRVIASVPENTGRDGDAEKFDAAEDDVRVGGWPWWPFPGPRPTRRAEPLADLQWDMQQIGATADGSYRWEKGRGVRVGIMDTGVDGSHPDIAPNFDVAASRNFTTDIPVDANGDTIDGPCEEEPDQSCNDPVDVDEDGHGTHVASTIASPINRIGIAGVAPRATIVNLRAGQDSGYFFLQPSVDALTYAGRSGIDVVNMSFYVDPWLFNCTDHPADTPEDRVEQQAIITAMQRALDFAHRRNVTLIAAAGNGATDYTKVISDASSPDFADVPGEAPYVRDLLDPASCISMPSEGEHVISVSSTGPSTRKAYYSDYGNGYVDVAAPGGDAYDTPTGDLAYAGLVLAAYPEALAIANEEVDENGEPVVPWVIRDCSSGTCAYYQYLQGTSMAAPHAAGVAALIVGKWGLPAGRGEKYLWPDATEWILRTSSTDTPCPAPPAYTYTRRVPLPDGTIDVRVTTHVCEGDPGNNGFYGDGIVNAVRAVGGH